MKTQTSDMADRLGKLERQVRLLAWSVIMGLATAVMLLAVMTVVGPRRLVRARGFVVTDEQGRVRGNLGELQGFAYLDLYDENGEAKVGLRASEGKSSLILNGPNGRFGTMVGAFNGAASLFIDDRGKKRVQIDLSSAGPMIALYDEDGKERATLAYRQTEDNRTTSGAAEHGADLVLSDGRGNIVFRAP